MIVAVVGLGYVGLPLAVGLSKKCEVIGFDISLQRLEGLINGKDITDSVSESELKNRSLHFTSEPSELRKADFVIIAVPTPIDDANDPDMSCLESSSALVGKNMKKGCIVVYESTVYPGATEEFCMPVLEKSSGMKCGQDFKIAYSPERINPGDKVHTLKTITKIVSGMDQETLGKVAGLYGLVVDNVYCAKSIKVAEAAKIIENTQRDINIALMNELSLIFDRMGIDTTEVINAAATKWNFHRYAPGLVGGHCISKDPHYLIYKAESLGYFPKVILAGRAVSDYIPIFLAEKVLAEFSKRNIDAKKSKVVIFGLTFKENVPDTRNSKIKKTIQRLKAEGVSVYGCDPFVEKDEIENGFGVNFVSLDDALKLKNADCIFVAVSHNQFKRPFNDFLALLAKNRVFVDVKRMFDKEEVKASGTTYIGL
jgi:UDP-N-acetyl-D-glucosamine/UDP-N-acetyl-D-galactosamine dehydrogenase